MKKQKKVATVDLRAAEALVADTNLAEELHKLHVLFDTVCLVEAQLPTSAPDELTNAALALRDEVGDYISQTIRRRSGVGRS